MKIPKNATPEWFDEQVAKGTFDAVEWVRWVRAKGQEAYEIDRDAFWKKMDNAYEEHIKEYGHDVLATDLEGAKSRKKQAA